MLWLAQWYADKKSNFLKFLQQQGSNPVLQTFFLIFMIFYIFEGCFAREIPFYVNLLTKLRKKILSVLLSSYQLMYLCSAFTVKKDSLRSVESTDRRPHC